MLKEYLCSFILKEIKEKKIVSLTLYACIG